MGIFSQTVKNSYEGYDSEITGNKSFEEAVLADDSLDTVFSENMDLTECGLQAIIDFNENYNMIEKALMGNELVYMEQTGKEYEYSDVVTEGFLESIKNFLKKVWEKIKALFKNFIMKLDSYMKNDKEFVNKYKKEIYSGKDLSDFKFKGYVFTINDGAVKAALVRCEDAGYEDSKKGIGSDGMRGSGSTTASLRGLAGDNEYTGKVGNAGGNAGASASGNETFEQADRNFEDNADTARGAIVKALNPNYNAGGKLDQSEFKKALFEALRNGESEKEELDKIEPTVYAGELVSSKDAKKTVRDQYRESEKIIKNMEKFANNIIKDKSKDAIPQTGDDSDAKHKRAINADKVRGANFYLKWVHFGSASLTAVNAAVVQALNDRSRQYKACLVKIAAYKPKSENAYEESYIPTGGSGFLADLALK